VKTGETRFLPFNVYGTHFNPFNVRDYSSLFIASGAVAPDGRVGRHFISFANGTFDEVYFEEDASIAAKTASEDVPSPQQPLSNLLADIQANSDTESAWKCYDAGLHAAVAEVARRSSDQRSHALNLMRLGEFMGLGALRERSKTSTAGL